MKQNNEGFGGQAMTNQNEMLGKRQHRQVEHLDENDLAKKQKVENF